MNYKANEYSRFVTDHINYYKKRYGKEASLLMSIPRFVFAGEVGDAMPIHGVLAYAGFSRNGRLYFPEELAHGHEKILPLLVNHASVLGMEMELDRLPQEYQERLLRGEEIQVGEVHLTWHPNDLTLTYSGEVRDPFFIREVKEGIMSVSLGVVYDGNAGEVCDVGCYTMIKGAEFEEVSLVYHAGFPVATIEATEAFLKQISNEFAENSTEINTYKSGVSSSQQGYTMSKKLKSDEADMGGISSPAAGTSPATGNCKEPNVMDAEGNCMPPEGSGSTAPDAPDKVVALTDVSETDSSDDDDDDEKKGKEAKGEDEDDDDDSADESETARKLKEVYKILGAPSKVGEATTPAGGANADLKSERKRTEERLAHIKKQEALEALKGKEAYLKAKELYLKELKLEREIKAAKEASQSKFRVGETNKDKVAEAQVIRPAQWLKGVVEHKNVPMSWEWTLDKQNIFEGLPSDLRYLKGYDEKGLEVSARLPDHYKKGTEAVTGPPSNDFMRVMSEQVLVLPGGKIVTPVRQFCEVKVLPTGTKEAFFYDQDGVSFSAITEDGSTQVTESATLVRSAGGAPTARGTKVTLGYSQLEESPIDLVASHNQAFALEGVNDESVAVLSTAYNNDAGSSGDASNRKAVGGGSKTGYWVNGNTGAQITGDSGLVAADKITFEGILAAKRVIKEGGFDTSNAVLYTSPKALDDLILDPDLDSYIGFNRPEFITEGVVERIAGVNIVTSSALASLAMGGVATGKRSVMFIPQVTFGLITGRDLTVEAQRRNDLQVVFLTATQKVLGVVKNKETSCRLSHS